MTPKERAWAATPVGKLFYAYERTLARAWQLDCREGVSDRKLREAWDESNQARAAFLEAIRTQEEPA